MEEILKQLKDQGERISVLESEKLLCLSAMQDMQLEINELRHEINAGRCGYATMRPLGIGGLLNGISGGLAREIPF